MGFGVVLPLGRGVGDLPAPVDLVREVELVEGVGVTRARSRRGVGVGFTIPSGRPV